LTFEAVIIVSVVCRLAVNLLAVIRVGPWPTDKRAIPVFKVYTWIMSEECERKARVDV
jgi:hypothetical protein